MLSPVDDRELARRCADGDAEAWSRLVRGNIDLVCRAVRRLLGGGPEADVEDVIQTLFLKLVEAGGRRLRTFEGRCKLSTWLVAVARREALEFLEKRKRAATPPPPSWKRLAAELQGDPAAGAEAEQASRRLQAALERLPTRDGILVNLVYVEGASYEEAARFLAVPLNSVSPWLVRAKERLRALLDSPVRPEAPEPSNG